MGTPTLVVVTGPAGAGKTTLAHELASVLGCPAVCRDEIKEGVVAAAPGFIAAEGDPATLRTYDLFFKVIALFVEHEVTLVAEAAFQHRLWERGLAPLTGRAAVRVVRCRVSDQTAEQRMLARLTTQPTRAAHADADHLAASQVFDAIHIDAPTLDVDTSHRRSPSLLGIADFCRA